MGEEQLGHRNGKHTVNKKIVPLQHIADRCGNDNAPMHGAEHVIVVTFHLGGAFIFGLVVALRSFSKPVSRQLIFHIPTKSELDSHEIGKPARVFR